MILEIFLIIFSVIALYSLLYGIYLVIFLMPLYLWRFSIFGIPSTALEAMIYILFLVWIINKITLLLKQISPRWSLSLEDSSELSAFSSQSSDERLRRGGRHIAKKQSYLLNFGIILLFLGAVISTSISSDLRTSLGILKGWFFDPFLFFVVFINVIKTKREMYLSLYSWLASGIAVSIISIFYLLNNDLTFDSRLYAFFLSPNNLAMYIAPAFLIALAFLINKASLNICNTNKKLEIGKLGNWEMFKKPITNYQLPITNYQLPITVLTIILIPLYFTYSHGAFWGIFAGGLYLIIANKNIFKKNKTKIYLIGLVLTAGLGFTFLISGKLNDILNSNDRSSFHSRLMIWSAAAEIIKDNSIFGIGPGTFQETYLSYAGRFSKPYLEWAVPQPHNVFLAFYLQAGLIGFTGFILILIWFFSGGRYEALPRIYEITVAIMIYFLVHGLVDTTYWKNDSALMFWLVIGLMVIVERMKRANSLY